MLVEHSDAEGEAHATAALEGLLGAALERGLIDDTAVATSLEQANAMWHLRESIPLAQAPEGPNIKHDIALPVSAIAEFVAATDAALLRRAFPGVRLVDFGHLGDGNLHYNVQGRGRGRRRIPAPRGRGQRHRLRRGGGARRLDLRPSTASACSSATSWPRASRRSRSP